MEPCTNYLIIKVLVGYCLWPLWPAKHDFVWFLDFVSFPAKDSADAWAIEKLSFRPACCPEICICRYRGDLEPGLSFGQHQCRHFIS